MQWTLHHLIEATGARLIHGHPHHSFSSISLDTRLPRFDDALFVALKGPRFDAHRYLHTLDCPVLVSSLQGLEVTAFEAVLLVPDTLVALQRFATWHRQQMPATVVGITGSNGKTEVKEMLRAIMSQAGTPAHFSPGSYNSQVGVALSLLQLRPHHQVAFIEAGISQPGEMEHLARMIQPDLGVFTNVGSAHLASFESLHHIATEKLKLFALSPDITLVYPGADLTLAALPLPPHAHPFEVHPPTITLPGGATFPAHFDAPHRWQNATAAATISALLGLPPGPIQTALDRWRPVHDRLEITTTPHGITLINDAYNADPTSTRAALGVLAQQAPEGPRIAVLGPMLDLGPHAPQAHKEIGEEAARVATKLIVYQGPSTEHLVQGALEAGMRGADVAVASGDAGVATLLASWAGPGATVLFKASRAIGLDRTARLLFETMGPTRLEIDLSAIRHNFHALKAHLAPHTAIMAVVKSFGYGSDANRVALTLLAEGIHAFGVAYTTEGITLRDHGIPLDIPILVTNTLRQEAERIVRHHLTALVGSIALVEALEHHAAGTQTTVDCHLELDTGMRRAGIRPEQLDSLLERIEQCAHVRLTGLMTHLVAADDPQEDPFTLQQLALFDAAVAHCVQRGHTTLTLHVANTAAAWRLPQASYGMVRLGLGLYGVSPSQAVQPSMAPTIQALRLVTQVIHLSDLRPGESVGYGRGFVAQDPMRLATIALGYNDGFPRLMSDGGHVLIHGRRCPVVGSVCMDVATVDVSALGQSVQVGDDVVIFGDPDGLVTLDEMAKRCHTISYEILCNISSRVHRIFLGLRGL